MDYRHVYQYFVYVGNCNSSEYPTLIKWAKENNPLETVKEVLTIYVPSTIPEKVGLQKLY